MNSETEHMLKYTAAEAAKLINTLHRRIWQECNLPVDAEAELQIITASFEPNEEGIPSDPVLWSEWQDALVKTVPTNASEVELVKLSLSQVRIAWQEFLRLLADKFGYTELRILFGDSELITACVDRTWSTTMQVNE